jgi:23S rRNA pseudouridine2605 synthase
MNQENENNAMRLNRYLALCGLGSRRRCDGIIASGRIYINGVKVDKLGTRVAFGRDSVAYKGRVLSPLEVLKYCAYHKPPGVIVTAIDPHGRATIYDAMKKDGFDASGLRYAGQLDGDSEGLLILTNDGGLIHCLTHPRFHIKKVYEVQSDARLSADDVRTMTVDGIESEGQLLRAGDVRELKRGDGFWYAVDLYASKKRQVRRMFEARGRRITRLIRIQFGPVKLGDQKPGSVRDLSERETGALRAIGYPVTKIGDRRP